MEYTEWNRVTVNHFMTTVSQYGIYHATVQLAESRMKMFPPRKPHGGSNYNDKPKLVLFVYVIVALISKYMFGGTVQL
jgi:hypothetical protein